MMLYDGVLCMGCEKAAIRGLKMDDPKDCECAVGGAIKPIALIASEISAAPLVLPEFWTGAWKQRGHAFTQLCAGGEGPPEPRRLFVVPSEWDSAYESAPCFEGWHHLIVADVYCKKCWEDPTKPSVAARVAKRRAEELKSDDRRKEWQENWRKQREEEKVKEAGSAKK
jgi:hypothetical protein